MPSYDGEKLTKMAKRACEEVELNRGIFIDAEELTIPFRNTWDNPPGMKTHNINTRNFDSTAMIAKQNFVNTMVNQAIPPFTRWVGLTAGSAFKDSERDFVNKSLEGINTLVKEVRDASNFYTSAPEMFHDVAISTGVLMVLEGTIDAPINYVAVPLSQMGMLEGKHGGIDFFVRKNNIEARLIKETWPKAKILPEIAKRIEASKNDCREHHICLHECFYYDYESMVWRYELLYPEAKEVLLKSTSIHCPIVTWRWSKVPGFSTGIGPVLMALSDIKTLNKLQELTLRMAALNVYGVYTAANDMALNPNIAMIQPGAIIPVSRNSGPEGPSLQRLETAGNFEAQQWMIQSMQEQVRKILLDDQYRVEPGVQRTAFEVSQIMRQLQTDIGAAFGRFLHEFAMNLVRREVEILANMGLIQLPQQFNIDNFFIKVQVTSPIAHAQNTEDVERFTYTYEILRNINPALAETALELASLPGYLVEKLGPSPSLFKDKQQIEMALQAQAEAAALMQAAQMEGGFAQQQQRMAA